MNPDEQPLHRLLGPVPAQGDIRNSEQWAAAAARSSSNLKKDVRLQRFV